MSVLPARRRLCRGLRNPMPTCCEDTVTPGRAESSVCLVRIWSASSCWASSSCKRDKVAWDGGPGCLPARLPILVLLFCAYRGELARGNQPTEKTAAAENHKNVPPGSPIFPVPRPQPVPWIHGPQDKLWRSWQEGWVSTAPKRQQTTQGKHLRWLG